MELIIVLIMIVVIVMIIKMNNRPTPQNTISHHATVTITEETVPKRKYAGIGTYEREKMTIELAGVHHRPEVFKRVSVGELLHIAFEPTNPYDKNAIAAYTASGELLGYIPRNQRKIIKTLRANPHTFATITYKGIYHNFKVIKVVLWLGFPKEEIDLAMAIQK